MTNIQASLFNPPVKIDKALTRRLWGEDMSDKDSPEVWASFYAIFGETPPTGLASEVKSDLVTQLPPTNYQETYEK